MVVAGLPMPMTFVPTMSNTIVGFCTSSLFTFGLILIPFLAPILKEVDKTLHTAHFNGSLLKENIFRQDAGPAVDAAWASLGVHCEIPCLMARS